MKMQSRSYRAKRLRPKPILHEQNDLTAVLFPWGDESIAARILPDIINYLDSALSEVEATSPFEHLTNLSDQANHLRTSLLIANESIYRMHNRDQVFGGLEALIICRKGDFFSFAKVGQPHLAIWRDQKEFRLLASARDLSDEIGLGIDDPFPAQLLGLESSINPECGDFYLQEKDKVVLLAATSPLLNEALQAQAMPELSSLTAQISQNYPDDPFWLGIISRGK